MAYSLKKEENFCDENWKTNELDRFKCEQWLETLKWLFRFRSLICHDTLEYRRPLLFADFLYAYLFMHIGKIG